MAVNFFEDKKGKMTVEDVGRRGGLKTSEKHGELFFREIGRKGGERRGKRNMAIGTKRSPGKDTKSLCINTLKKLNLIHNSIPFSLIDKR